MFFERSIRNQACQGVCVIAATMWATTINPFYGWTALSKGDLLKQTGQTWLPAPQKPTH